MAQTVTDTTTSPGEIILDIRNLHKSFGQTEVLKGIDLTAHRGEVISLIGGSGSGKSTTLRCLNLLEMPTSYDSFTVFDTEMPLTSCPHADYKVQDPKKLRQLRRRLAMVFQNFNLWPHLSLCANVMEAQIQTLGRSRQEARDISHHYLDQVGLSAHRDSYPAYLSGGQQQRGAIARALAVDPDILLFDEPTSALDPELVGDVLKVIRSLAEEGRTLILVTHELRFAAEVSDRIMFLHQGLVAETGPADQFFQTAENADLKRFIKKMIEE